MASYHLPAMLKRLRDEAPGIVIEIIAANDVRDLTRREADIAIRHARPEQPDLIAKLVGETSAHLYASKAYLDKHGRPTSPEDLVDADFIGFETPERLVPVVNAMGLPLTKDNFRINTASGTVILELVKQGLGISIGTRDVETLAPDVERVLPHLDPLPVPIWLVTHRELHTSRRIRLVFDHLAEAISEQFREKPASPGGAS
jgi:DNA-binding transcriptional LysR family regulator